LIIDGQPEALPASFPCSAISCAMACQLVAMARPLSGADFCHCPFFKSTCTQKILPCANAKNSRIISRLLKSQTLAKSASLPTAKSPPMRKHLALLLPRFRVWKPWPFRAACQAVCLEIKFASPFPSLAGFASPRLSQSPLVLRLKHASKPVKGLFHLFHLGHLFHLELK